MTTVPHWVRDYIGLPWADRGRDRAGVDCYGLVRLVLAEQAGLPLLEHLESYASATDAAAARALHAQAGTAAWPRIPAGSEQPLDLVRIRPAHLGVVVAPGVMLHIERDLACGATLARYREPPWASRVESFHRHVVLGKVE